MNVITPRHEAARDEASTQSFFLFQLFSFSFTSTNPGVGWFSMFLSAATNCKQTESKVCLLFLMPLWRRVVHEIDDKYRSENVGESPKDQSLLSNRRTMKENSRRRRHCI